MSMLVTNLTPNPRLLLLRKISIFLVLLLGSCNTTAPWRYQENITDCKRYNSAMLSYPPSNKFTGIELQFLRGQFGLQGYLNVYSRHIPLLPSSLNQAVFVIQIEDQQYRYQSICMEGGQRLLLPQRATNQIIDALLACQTVIIYLEGFSTEVSPCKFQSLYKQFTSVRTS